MGLSGKNSQVVVRTNTSSLSTSSPDVMGLFLIWKVEASLKSSSSKTPVKYFSGIFQGCYRWYSPKTPAIFLFFASSYRETSQSLHWQTLQNTIVLANLWFQARVWKRDSQIDGMIGPTNLYDPKEQEILYITNLTEIQSTKAESHETFYLH